MTLRVAVLLLASIWGSSGAIALAAASEPVSVVQLVAPGHPAYLLAAKSMKEAFVAAHPQAQVTTINLDLPEAERKAKEALARKPTLVFAVGSRAARVSLERLGGAPLVYAMVLDPSSLGLPSPGESSPARIAGVSMDVAADQQFDLMRSLSPSATRIGVLYDPLISGDAVRRAHAAAKSRGFTIVAQAVRSEGEVMPAASLLLPGVDILWAVADPTVLTAANSRALILLSLRGRKPLFAVSEGFVRSGALAAMAADPAEVGRRAGEIAVRLEGETSKPIRSEGPPHLLLFLNRATAEHIGLSLPQSIIDRAKVVYPLP